MKSVKLSKKRPSVGTKCVISGWGSTSSSTSSVADLHYANVELLDFNKCRQSIRMLTHGMLCAGNWEGIPDACGVNILLLIFSSKLCDEKAISPDYCNIEYINSISFFRVIRVVH